MAACNYLERLIYPRHATSVSLPHAARLCSCITHGPCHKQPQPLQHTSSAPRSSGCLAQVLTMQIECGVHEWSLLQYSCWHVVVIMSLSRRHQAQAYFCCQRTDYSLGHVQPYCRSCTCWSPLLQCNASMPQPAVCCTLHSCLVSRSALCAQARQALPRPRSRSYAGQQCALL